MKTRIIALLTMCLVIQMTIGITTSVAAETLEINKGNFPDAEFRSYISKEFDTDNDGYLSEKEIAAADHIDVMYLPIKDLTGIKKMTGLRWLACAGCELKTVDVSGMKKLEEIVYFGNDNLTTLDFRNCPNLYSGFHSNKEVVYISAGMTKYIGCPYIGQHTGNIVIDLSGYYTINDDGSKTVDMKKVISPELLQIFSEKDQPGFNKATGILKIPAGVGKSEFTAGEDLKGGPCHWDFYTNIVNVNDVVITFNSNGGTVVDAQTIRLNGQAIEPSVPTMDGYDFAGWYADKELTNPWDFSTTVSKDVMLYAKWTEATPDATPEPPAAPTDESTPEPESQVLGEETAPDAPEAIKATDPKTADASGSLLTYALLCLFFGGLATIIVIAKVKRKPAKNE